jgi:hypothetical protein
LGTARRGPCRKISRLPSTSAGYPSAFSRKAFRALHAYRPTNRNPDPIGGLDTDASFATVLRLHHHLTIKNGAGSCPSLLEWPGVSAHLGAGVRDGARLRAGGRAAAVHGRQPLRRDRVSAWRQRGFAGFVSRPDPIHRSAWNRNSANFVFWDFCEVTSQLDN